jgi:hypothetical protein
MSGTLATWTAQSVWRLATGWMIWRSNPGVGGGGGEIFRTLGLTQPPVQWVPVLSPWVKWPERGADPPPTYIFSAVVLKKDRDIPLPSLMVLFAFTVEPLPLYLPLILIAK